MTGDIRHSGSDDHYRILFEIAPISISIASLDDSIIDVNPQFTKFLGYAKEEVIGNSFSDLTHPDEAEKSLKHYNEMINGNIDHFSMEKRYLTKDGRWVWGHSVAVLLPGSDGEPDRVLAMQQDINELKGIENDLKEKESFLRSVTDNLTEGVLVVGKDGYLKYVNRTAQKFTSLETTDIHVKEWASAFGIFSADQVTLLELNDRPILKALSGESVIGLPIYVRQTASGKGTHILIDAVPILDEDGNVESALALFRDISDLRKVEERLDAGTSQIKALLESVPDMIVRLDSLGRFRYVKENTSDHFAFFPKNLLGKNISEVFGPSDSAAHLGYVLKALKTEQLQRYETVLEVKGENRLFEIRMMKAGQDEVTVLIRDFTEAHQKELDREEKEARLVALIEAWPDLLFRLSGDGVFLEYKVEKDEELLVSPSIFLGKNMTEILPPYLCELFLPVMAKAIKTGKVQTVDYQVEMPQGTLDYEARIVGLGNGELVFYGRNISDRKNQEKEIISANKQLEAQTEHLVELNKELEQYAYYAAHDIKGPVNNMRSLLEMLREEKGVKQESMHLLDKVDQSIKEMKRIIKALNDVLDMRKGLDIRAERASISKTVVQVTAALSEIIRSNGVQVTKKIISKDDIRISSTHLHSVLQNLILNAIKYRDPEKKAWVKMETHSKDGATIIEVSDNGLGFDQERIGDRVFDVFKRYHDHVPGKGIGLYLVRSIVESYNGTIEVVSELKIGSKFVITIPEE
ncbi:MAG: PAS domain S-box-containing protein [Bacteroidia bacterium]|jgi:PAS domain S-box-containing protein